MDETTPNLKGTTENGRRSCVVEEAVGQVVKESVK